MAAPKAKTSSAGEAACAAAGAGAATKRPQATSPAMAAIFRTMSADCTPLPKATPTQFTAVSARSAPIASAHSGIAAPTSARVKRAKISATAAIPPDWITSSSVQP